MTTAIDIRELPTRLDEALAVASAGGEVILLEGATPRARLAPFGSAPPLARPACTPSPFSPLQTSTPRLLTTSGLCPHEAAAGNPCVYLVR